VRTVRKRTASVESLRSFADLVGLDQQLINQRNQ
jgi:hypothetical protein